MFGHCVYYSQNLDNVIEMSCMFERAIAFNQDLSKWDTSSVSRMEYMFYQADSFDTEKHTNTDMKRARIVRTANY